MDRQKASGGTTSRAKDKNQHECQHYRCDTNPLTTV